MSKCSGHLAGNPHWDVPPQTFGEEGGYETHRPFVLIQYDALDRANLTAAISFSVGTDNQGNDAMIKKFLTTKWPLCAVAMEVAL